MGKILTLLYVWEKIKYTFPSPVNLFLCNQYLFPILCCSSTYLLIKHYERIDTQGPRFTCFCSFNVGEFYVFNTQNDFPEKKEKGERGREERKVAKRVNLINLSPYGYASPKHVLALPFFVLSEADLENIDRKTDLTSSEATDLWIPAVAALQIWHFIFFVCAVVSSFIKMTS